MDAVLAARFIALNRRFYAEFARSFSETRPPDRVNLDPILPQLADGVKVLDAGCGNGRIVTALDRARLRLNYLGVDATPELLAMARARRMRHVRAEFREADLTVAGWPAAVADRAPFAVALMTAVLHHMPGYALRARIVRELRGLLAPDGVLILSNWQFDRVDRLRRKIAPWSVIGVDLAAVEPGDALIDWRRSGAVGYRYCHLLTEAEVERMAAECGFRVERQFVADGEMNLYSVLKADNILTASGGL